MIFSVDQLFFLLLTLLSHICASLFFAKPRYGKAATAAIWLFYGVVFIALPHDMPAVNFFISFAVHMLLFFVTTTGRWKEKGFLFLSYACIYTCVSVLYRIVDPYLPYLPLKMAFALILLGLMQLLLYVMMLPAFRKVTPYIHSGWGKFYYVLLGYFALLVSQAVFPIMSPMTEKEITVFLLTALVFCGTYLAVFASMKSIVELAQEKRKQIHAELLLSQVQAQAKEAEVVRQNRHDMRHHYQQLLSYADSGDLEKITDYLKRQTERIENLTSGRFCENETVNNILRVYHQKAAEQNVAMQIVAAAKPTLSAAAPDLVAIIANVLENALNGAVKSGSASPFISVKIRHKAQRFVLNCDNACDPALRFDEMPESLRGIGIQSVTATADQYAGSCRFCARDGVFRCTVIMDE